MPQNPRLFNLAVARLGRLPVAKHPGLLFNMDVEGYRDYTFGGRAGPDRSPRHLMHELAHACQFGPEKFGARAKPDGFVFKTPKVFVYDRYCEEPATNQAVLRELDTFAYAMHLERLAGYTVSDEKYASYAAYLMRLMPDWYNVLGETEEERMQWCQAQILELHAQKTVAETVGRLEAWLDKTYRRLRSKTVRRPYHVVEQRFTGIGAIYAG